MDKFAGDGFIIPVFWLNEVSATISQLFPDSRIIFFNYVTPLASSNLNPGTHYIAMFL